jgi:hypothetical protein
MYRHVKTQNMMAIMKQICCTGHASLIPDFMMCNLKRIDESQKCSALPGFPHQPLLSKCALRCGTSRFIILLTTLCIHSRQMPDTISMNIQLLVHKPVSSSK